MHDREPRRWQQQQTHRARRAAAGSISFVRDSQHPTTQLIVDLHRGEPHSIRNFVQKVQKIICGDNCSGPAAAAASLELDVLLTTIDVAEARVPATLCIFCSKSGLHPLVDNSYHDHEASATVAAASASLGVLAEFPTKKRSSYYMKFSGDQNIAKGIRYTSGSTAPVRLSDQLYVLSNGYCIQFEVPAEATDQGCVIPWWKTPTTFVHHKLRSRLHLHALGSPRLTETPKTTIIIPLRRADQVRTVQEELRSLHLHPHCLMSFSDLNKLELRDDVSCDDIVTSGRALNTCLCSSSSRALIFDRHRLQNVTFKKLPKCCPPPRMQQLALLQVVDEPKIGFSAMYKIFQQTYPATIQLQELQGRDSAESNKAWVIELVFPTAANEGSYVDLPSGPDVYAVNYPSKLRSGFPFLINANFVLDKTGPDNDDNEAGDLDIEHPWNKGILDCIPQAFQVAFEGLHLYKSSYGVWGGMLDFGRIDIDIAVDAYKAIPLQTVQPVSTCETNPDTIVGGGKTERTNSAIGAQKEVDRRFRDGLEGVRRKILENLTNLNVVMISSQVGHTLPPDLGIYYCKPMMGRLIISTFREMLELAHAHQGVHATSLKTSPFFVVDGEAQRSNFMALKALEVPHMSWPEYMEILVDTSFLTLLSEEAYVKLLEFVSSIPHGPLEAIPLVKHRGRDGALPMASISQTKKEMMIFFSRGSLSNDESLWLSEWMALFEPWARSSFIPDETVRAILQSERKDAICKWLRRSAGVLELTIKHYAQKLVDMFITRAVDLEVTVRATQFLFISIQANYLQRSEALEYMRSLNCYCVVDKDGDIFEITPSMWTGTLVLPRPFSKWGLLLDSKWAEQFAIEISVEYFKGGSPTSQLIRSHMKTFGENIKQISNFLRDAFGIVDVPELKPTLHSGFTSISVEGKEKTLLLLKWLTVFLPQRSASTRSEDLFLNCLQNTPWLKTVHHGMKSPSSAFLCSLGGDSHHFSSSDLPFIDTVAHGDLSDFQEVLEELGAVVDTKLETTRGCQAVAKYLAASYKQPAARLDQSVASRLYNFLETQGWKGCELIPQIWVPPPKQSAVPKHETPQHCHPG